jgi:hypothetical protein
LLFRFLTEQVNNSKQTLTIANNDAK